MQLSENALSVFMHVWPAMCSHSTAVCKLTPNMRQHDVHATEKMVDDSVPEREVLRNIRVAYARCRSNDPQLLLTGKTAGDAADGGAAHSQAKSKAAEKEGA